MGAMNMHWQCLLQKINSVFNYVTNIDSIRLHVSLLQIGTFFFRKTQWTFIRNSQIELF